MQSKYMVQKKERERLKHKNTVPATLKNNNKKMLEKDIFLQSWINLELHWLLKVILCVKLQENTQRKKKHLIICTIRVKL